MKKQRKVLKVTGLIVLIFLSILFAAPFFFKGKILQLVKEQANRQLNAHTGFSDISLSFFRHFPQLTLGIQHPSIIGIGEFSSDTLLSADELSVSLNPFSLLNTENMKISSVLIDHPRIHALVHPDGKANWDILKSTGSSADSSSTSPFRLKLNHYAIREGYIEYRDDEAGIRTEIAGLNHEGSGDFNANLFTLKTSSSAQALTVEYGGIPYLSAVKTAVDADFQVDNQQGKYSFKTDAIYLNALQLAVEGFFQIPNDSSYNMDIQFKAPAADFKNILSMVPAIYRKNFDRLQAGGKALFDGYVKGIYGPRTLPSYALNLEVTDGFFRYPDLPESVSSINMKVHLANPDGLPDHSTVDIPQAHFQLGRDPIDFHLQLKNPMSNRWIDAGLRGKINLSSISRFLPLEAGTNIGGQLAADLQATGNLSAIMQQQPGPFSARGFLEVQGLSYQAKDLPHPLSNCHARIEISNPDGLPDHTLIEIPTAHIQLDKDAADFSLLIRTPASDPDFSGTLKGNLQLASLEEFSLLPSGSSLSGSVNGNISFAGKKSYITQKKYGSLRASGTLSGADIRYTSKDYPDGLLLRNASLKLENDQLDLTSLQARMLETDIAASGSFENLAGYYFNKEALKGRFQVQSPEVNLNKWMGTAPPETDSAAKTGASQPFQVPGNLDLLLEAQVDKLTYDKVDYRDVKGSLLIRDKTVDLRQVSMQALEGSIALNGSYSTKLSPENPDISLQYNVQNLDVQKTFYAYNTVRQLMPIGQFIAGKLSSTLQLKGKLRGNMMPDMGTLTGEGTLFLVQGFLRKFQPLEKIAQTLQVSDLQEISMKDIKNYFEFANGKVLVKPFHVRVKDIDMEIAGMHGLDQSLDYVINVTMPRSELGTAANKLVDNLVTDAASKGIPVKLGDQVKFRIRMGGTLTHPSIETGLQSGTSTLTDALKDQVKELAAAKKQAADSALAMAKKETRDSVASVKKQLLQDAADALKKQLSGSQPTDSGKSQPAADSKQKLEESAKGLLNSLLKKKKKEPDSTRKNQ